MPDAEINVISEEGNGDLWIGTTGSGVLKFDGSSFAIYTSFNSNLSHDHVTGIAKDQQGQIWVSTYLGGAAKFDGTDWIVFNDTNSDLSDNMLRAMETDQDGMIWFCTYDEGLDRFDGTNWVHFDYPNPGFIGEVADLFINNQNVLWIASDQGLYQFNGTEWTSFTTENSPMEDNLIRTVTGDAENNIWIGTSYHGIYKYSPNQGVSIMENEMNNNEMTIFPNPSNDHSKINFENANRKGAVLSVFDLSGKLLLRKETNEDHFVVDRNGLKSPGIYLISVQTQSKSFTGKLVVE